MVYLTDLYYCVSFKVILSSILSPLLFYLDSLILIRSINDFLFVFVVSGGIIIDCVLVNDGSGNFSML